MVPINPAAADLEKVSPAKTSAGAASLVDSMTESITPKMPTTDLMFVPIRFPPATCPVTVHGVSALVPR